jgi:hypothetical protein
MSNPINEFVPNVHFELIPIKNLVSNQNYQRNISTNYVKKTAENFDVNQINPVKVSRRDGINYVFNGQHTIEVVALVSGSRDTPVWCMIYDDLIYEHEADIFANQQKFTKPLLPYEIFMANVEAGNDRELMIKDLVESYGLTICSGHMNNGICAISALENIIIKYGFHVLDRVLRLSVSTWEGSKDSLSANMLNGIAIVVNACGDELKDDIFVDKIGSHSPKEISRTAHDRKAGSFGYAETLILEYNRGTRPGGKHPVSLENLYDKSKKKTTLSAAGATSPSITEESNSDTETDQDKNENFSNHIDQPAMSLEFTQNSNTSESSNTNAES